MSIKDVGRIVERASGDFDFLNQLNKDPDRALAGYDLSPEERSAVLRGDPGELEALGVEPRITKAIN
jgi:hypothetical protein